MFSLIRPLLFTCGRDRRFPEFGKVRSIPEYPQWPPFPFGPSMFAVSLVLVPVRLYPATSTEGTIAFRINHPAQRQAHQIPEGRQDSARF